MGYTGKTTLSKLYDNPITKAKAKRLIAEHKKNNIKDILNLPDGHSLNYCNTEGYYLTRRLSDAGIIFTPYVSGLTNDIQSEDRIKVNSRYAETKDMLGSFYKRIKLKDTK